LRKNLRNEFGVQSQEDAATGDGGDAEESATVKEGGAHGISLRIGFRPGYGLVKIHIIVTLNGIL
jgi:hypothetical protein